MVRHHGSEDNTLGQTIVKPTALGPGANTDTKLLIYGLFQKGRVLAQDGMAALTGRRSPRNSTSCVKSRWYTPYSTDDRKFRKFASDASFGPANLCQRWKHDAENGGSAQSICLAELPNESRVRERNRVCGFSRLNSWPLDLQAASLHPSIPINSRVRWQAQSGNGLANWMRSNNYPASREQQQRVCLRRGAQC